MSDTQSDSIQFLNFAKKWFIQYLIQYSFTQDSIQKSQIDMMMRIQKEMRMALWERVQELEENKVRIEEENEKLQERIV